MSFIIRLLFNIHVGNRLCSNNEQWYSETSQRRKSNNFLIISSPQLVCLLYILELYVLYLLLKF